MTDQDVRDFLERMAAEEPVRFPDPGPLTRRARRRAARTLVVGAIGVAAVVVAMLTGLAGIRTAPVPAEPPEEPSVDLGIFAPVAGWIVYGDRDGIWGVDPAAPDAAGSVRLTSEPDIPIAWSSDGTRLLIMRQIRGERGSTWHPFVLDADGSATKVAKPPTWGLPTISPDGTRVVFADYPGLKIDDVSGGRPAVLLDEAQIDELYAPTFSPDGTQIAYVDGAGDHSHSVWVMNADGSDAHQILANETTMGAGHVTGLEWSPAGDRIALGLAGTIYTFATDGSGFARVITNGDQPYWSPDGSQLVYIIPGDGEDGPLAIANTDGSNARELVFRTSSGPLTSGPWHPAPRGAA